MNNHSSYNLKKISEYEDLLRKDPGNAYVYNYKLNQYRGKLQNEIQQGGGLDSNQQYIYSATSHMENVESSVGDSNQQNMFSATSPMENVKTINTKAVNTQANNNTANANVMGAHEQANKMITTIMNDPAYHSDLKEVGLMGGAKNVKGASKGGAKKTKRTGKNRNSHHGSKVKGYRNMYNMRGGDFDAELANESVNTMRTSTETLDKQIGHADSEIKRAESLLNDIKEVCKAMGFEKKTTVTSGIEF